MRLADAARAHENQAAINSRIFAHQTKGVVEGTQLRAVAFHRIIILHRTFAVATRDARRFEQLRLTLLRATATTLRSLARNNFHPASETELTDGLALNFNL